jgi:DNA-binding MarR family transcriptional regulator
MTETFIDAHPLAGAFVANQLERLAALIVAQGDALLEDAGVSFPPRAVSTVLLMGERGGMSVADIAKTLAQPHQLVTQRIELLIELGIVRRADDPDDGRRKIVVLTAKGIEQARRLGVCLARAKAAFAGLFKEIDCDLPSVILRAMQALERSPLSARAGASKRATA